MPRFILLLCIGLVVAAVAVRGGSVPPEHEKLAEMIRATCISETGATVEMIENGNKGIFADDDKFKCYLKCVPDQLGMIDEDEFDFESMLAMMPEEVQIRGRPAMNICRKESGKDLCEKAFNFTKCMHRENPEDFFIP